MEDKCYALFYDGKFIGIINQDLLKKLERDDSKRSLFQNVIGKDIKFNFKEKSFFKDMERKEKEDLFVKSIVQEIKGQLLINDDMDIVIPEKARDFIPQINSELRKQGISLEHPLRECIDDLSPLAKFQDKWKREKERNRSQYLGRDRDE